MTTKLDLLLVEDNASDAGLIVRHLRKAGFEFDYLQIDTEPELRTALEQRRWSAVLCDYSLCGFDAGVALDAVRQTGLDLPFIVVSGEISDEKASRLMRAGAHDYVMKDNLARLAPALARELDEVHQRRARRAAERSAEEHARRLQRSQQVIDSLREGITVTDLQGTIVDVNPSFEAITGYSRAEVLGCNPRILKSGRHPPAFYETLWHTLVTTGTWRGEIWNRRKNGEIYPELLTLSAVRGSDGLPTHYVAVFSDLSKEKQTEAHIHWLTNHDALTGLANRQLFMDRLQQAIEAAANGSHDGAAVLLLDLDRFRRINESLGQEAGDKLLQHIAGRLQLCLKGRASAARLGSDEFLVLLTQFADTEAIAAFAHRILDEIARPCTIGGHEISVTASLGISVFPDDGRSAADLLRAAEAARAPIRYGHHNRLHFFTSGMDNQARRWMEIESELRQALERRELQLYYQPLLCARDGRIRSLEALARWHSPALGWVSPAEFVPVAEESGLIVAIGDWVLHTACAQARRWQDNGLPPVRVAVNVSAHQIATGALPERIREVLARTGLPAAQLEIELTESTMMADTEFTSAQVEAISRMGVSVALDDFGTGYSSLAYLSRFALNKVKIDRSFVHKLASDPKSTTIIAATVGLARGLGLQVVAEGVETEAQQRTLIAAGCDALQGYLFSPPIAAADLSRLSALFAPCEPYATPRTALAPPPD
ncbi:putative bifunctional diguanylate cyclase/phosphodiesterase [Thauera aromatica]|uniref:putative bifunctional diguanylate cyclase/phosphodiesterase n=1 Tax=Thauera aromatica TaxID=59405 RepID=UPI001FFCA744|nr:EAL domain-containing protein [Thauera aromatica]MCK2095772.1 EAL domain-containing protein [Thauera aromatica]